MSNLIHSDLFNWLSLIQAAGFLAALLYGAFATIFERPESRFEGERLDFRS